MDGRKKKNWPLKGTERIKRPQIQRLSSQNDERKESGSGKIGKISFYQNGSRLLARVRGGEREQWEVQGSRSEVGEKSIG